MSADLLQKAQEFASDITAVLNRTVCNGAKARPSRIPGDGTRVIVGHGLSQANPAKPLPFPVRLNRENPSCYLNLNYRLCLDECGEHLTVLSSFVGIFADEAAQLCLCHYDYERNKTDDYPEAHLHVFGASPGLRELNHGRGRVRGLNKLHFPVGGRRYRPTLEDVIEFLIVEGFATPRPGWQAVIKQHRRRFHRIQLRAVIRRDPETAEAAIRGYAAA